jgi:uncharacterized protein DUF3617
VRNLKAVRNSLIVCGVVLVAMRVVAAGMGLKPGLWETHLTKQVLDGKDTTAQIGGAAAQMQKMLANMSPDQRARMEAMMKEHGASMGSSDGSIRMCISPEMANRDTPWVDPKGRCQPAKVTRSGNQASYEINCASEGTTTTGKGTSTVSGDLVTTQMDMTTTRSNGETHVSHTEAEMKFLGADCGDVKPLTPPSASSAPK